MPKYVVTRNLSVSAGQFGNRSKFDRTLPVGAIIEGDERHPFIRDNVEGIGMPSPRIKLATEAEIKAWDAQAKKNASAAKKAAAAKSQEIAQALAGGK